MNDTYFFSAISLAFYPLSLKPDYESAGNWPSDATEINTAQYDEYSGQSPDGKLLGSSNGLPAWVDAPPLTPEKLIAKAESKRAELRAKADYEITPLQDAVDLDEATEEEISLLKEWKKYRVLLMRVDTSVPDSITWPQPPA